MHCRQNRIQWDRYSCFIFSRQVTIYSNYIRKFKSVRNRCVIEVFGGVCVCCPLVFEFSVGIGGFVIGLGQISFFSFYIRSCIIVWNEQLQLMKPEKGGGLLKLFNWKSMNYFYVGTEKSILFKTYESMQTPLTCPPLPSIKSSETKLYWKHPNYA